MPTTGADDSPRITAIRRRGRNRREVTTSDGEAFTLQTSTLEQAGLREGEPLDHARRSQLEREDERATAHTAALRLLSYRPRSEWEIRERLHSRGMASEVVDDEVERLQQAGLLDDQRFAHAWVEERQTNAPRGQRLLRSELRARGVDTATTDAAISSIDDRTAALAVARRWAPRLAGLAYAQFSSRLSGYLQRRGFGYEEVAAAVRVVWDETAPERDRESEAGTEADAPRL